MIGRDITGTVNSFLLTTEGSTQTGTSKEMEIHLEQSLQWFDFSTPLPKKANRTLRIFT